MTHPRLFFTAQELDRLRQKAQDGEPNPFTGSFRDGWTAVEQTARQYLAEDSFTWTYYGGKAVTYTLPPREPELFANPPGFTVQRYPYWTGMANGIKLRMEALAFAYSITGESAFGERACAYALALCDWESWSDPTYNCSWSSTCLDTGYLVQGVSAVYDQCHDLLTADEAARIRWALVWLGLVPLYRDTAKRQDHNIHMVRASALGYASLVLLGEEPEAEAGVERAIENFKWWLDLRLTSQETEGMLYTNVTMNHAMSFGDALLRVTGRGDLMRHPYVTQELAPWVAYFLAPGGKGLTNFSDASLVNYFATSMSTMAYNNGDGLAGWYLQETGAAKSTQPGFLYLSRETPVTAPSDLGLPLSAHFERIGWAALRTGWAPSDTLLAFQASPSSAGHNHFDQNHFVLNVAGEWLITDPGYQDYNPGPKNDVTEGTLGHNALLVNGKGQVRKGGARVTGFRSEADLDYVGGEAAGAYDGVDSWHRQIGFAKPEYLLIRDTVRLAEADVPELLVHTDTAASLTLEGRRFTIAKPGAAVTGELLLPAAGTLRQDIVPGAEEWGPFVRLGAGEPTEAVDFLWLLVLAPGGASPDLRVQDLRVEGEFVSLTVAGPGWVDRWSITNDGMERVRRHG